MTNDQTSPPNMMASSPSALPALIRPPSLCEVALSKRQLGQRKRRERERAARKADDVTPSSHVPNDIQHHEITEAKNGEDREDAELWKLFDDWDWDAILPHLHTVIMYSNHVLYFNQTHNTSQAFEEN
jgi:hypothetical protein